MEVNTIYYHKSKSASDSLEMAHNKDYRVVTFIGGDKDILDIIKELIKTKYQS